MKYTHEQVSLIQEKIKKLQDELNSLSNDLNNSNKENNEHIEELYSFNIPYNPHITKGDRYYIGINCTNCISNTDYLFCPVIYSGKSPANPNSHIFETLRTFYVKGDEITQDGKYLQQRDINKIESIPYNLNNPRFSELVDSISSKLSTYKLYLIRDDIMATIPSIVQTNNSEKYWDLISHVPITLEKKLYHFPNDFITY